MARRKSAASQALALDQIEPLIHEIRGEKVILDSDLARLYGVEKKALNRAVKRNAERFPEDFVFQVISDEFDALRYQSGTSKRGAPSQAAVASGKRGGRRYLPYAFTEHGAIMAANVLNSPRAVQMSVFVVRAFLKMRTLLGDKSELARQLGALEQELKQRLDVHEAAIVTILQRVMDLIDPPSIRTSKRHLATYGRWSFAEFTDIYEIQSDFVAKVESELNKMIETAAAEPAKQPI